MKGDAKMFAFLNGDYIPKEKLRISPDDRGFLFADGVYEVIRSYNGGLFQVEAHLKRLERNVRELRIPYADIDSLKMVAERLIRENDLTSGQATIYLQITRGSAPRLHRFPVEEVPATVYACANLLQPHDDELQKGTKVILVPDIRWSRCDIKSISLLPNVLAHQQAVEKGATEAIFVRDGAITEGTHSNFCGIFQGQFMTAPKSNYILPGITREIVLGLCHQLDIPIKESPILKNQLRKADELLIVGTTVEITPVVQGDDWLVGNGKPGPVTQRLQKAFYQLVKRNKAFS
ncbi:MAG: D-amino-acid transaminase [Acidobacteriota bacterium]